MHHNTYYDTSYPPPPLPHYEMNPNAAEFVPYHYPPPEQPVHPTAVYDQSIQPFPPDCGHQCYGNQGYQQTWYGNRGYGYSHPRGHGGQRDRGGQGSYNMNTQPPNSYRPESEEEPSRRQMTRERGYRGTRPKTRDNSKRAPMAEINGDHSQSNPSSTNADSCNKILEQTSKSAEESAEKVPVSGERTYESYNSYKKNKGYTRDRNYSASQGRSISRAYQLRNSPRDAETAADELPRTTESESISEANTEATGKNSKDSNHGASSRKIQRGATSAFGGDFMYSTEDVKHQNDAKVQNSSKGSHRSAQQPVDLRPGAGKQGKKFYGRNKQSEGKWQRQASADETQRGSLVEQLNQNSYECMVCCEVVWREAAIWSCLNCYHIYHLRCVKKWARSPAAAADDQDSGQGWQCPACRNICVRFPTQYRCFCGKVRDPEFNRYETPHSCGDVCGRKRGEHCVHTCNILCHPGPCPPCQAMTARRCDCGKLKKVVKCGQVASFKCDAKCRKTLNCGKHECQAVCHTGPCEPCEETVKQACYCGKKDREVVCGTTDFFAGAFVCPKQCAKKLNCGNHQCDRQCHPGACAGCQRLPAVTTRCPCGKTPLAELTKPGLERTKCTDAIPACDNLCEKPFGCGPTGDPHICLQTCHEGPCGKCDGVTSCTCRCGSFTKDVDCKEAMRFTASNPFKCDKRCNKRRQCGRHRCSNNCCVDPEHKCNLVCGQKLSCGQHRCKEPCHVGKCPTCWNVSFEELSCHCGKTIIEPPIACGVRPPDCPFPCQREHACDHDVLHNCHSEERCPPCAQLTSKWCMGRHEMRKNIPCHINNISCGMKCGKTLPCRQHKCLKMCHQGDCLSEDENCEQPCTHPREACSHPCGVPCHSGKPCPKVACRAEVTIYCDCGNRSEKALCQHGGDDSEFHRMSMSVLAMQISSSQEGQSIDMSSMAKKPRKLECNQECAVKERNKRLALALEIKNPDVSGKLGNPTYSQFLKDYARQNTSFVAGIDKQLSELVNMAQQSKQPKRSHAFPPMNRDQRQLVHELAEHYGCETQSYDQEPKKNVVATAYKNKCWHPSVMLSTLIERELHPKAPMPLSLGSTKGKIGLTNLSAKKTGEVPNAWGRPPIITGSAKPGTSRTSPPATTGRKCTSPVIDYFDMSE